MCSKPRHRNLRRYKYKRLSGLKHIEKLTVDDVDYIRKNYRYQSRDANCRVFAEMFGVSITTVHNIIREKRWLFDDWYFRERSSEPKNDRHIITKRELKAMEWASERMLEYDPTNKKAIQLRKRYLEIARRYRCKKLK